MPLLVNLELSMDWPRIFLTLTSFRYGSTINSAPRAHSKTYKVPRRPYESARLDAELKVGS